MQGVCQERTQLGVKEIRKVETKKKEHLLAIVKKVLGCLYKNCIGYLYIF